MSMYDYADLSERLLGHGSPLVLYDRESRENDDTVVAKFRRRFGDAQLVGGVWDNNQQIDALLLRERVTHFIVLTTGLDDGLRLSPRVRHCVSAIFVARAPHGDRCVRASEEA